MQKKTVKVNDTETKEVSMPEVGDTVVFVDPFRKEHNALVTQVWSGKDWQYAFPPGINLVIVSGDASKEDSYGRQIERHTSIPSNESPGTPPGNYWKQK